MSSFEFEKELRVTETGIPGLKVVDLPVHGDARGWFKENWQRAKMVAAGLPDFRPVQNNVSFNASRGVTRGIHAEPWDKYISVATGSVFGAWVDLRPGATFGRVFTTTLDPSRAIFVPRGVGNSFQALEDGTAYTYLVDAHWSAELKATYTFVNLADPALGIDWPIPLSEATLSEADLRHPMLADALPMAPRRTLVTGCNGQLGHAVRELAEARGQSKAAGDLAVGGCPRHYLVRSSWVVGEGRNFARTMAALSDRVADPADPLDRVTVVDDQLGRLTFTRDMAAAILWLLGYRDGDLEPSAPAAYGTYDLTNSGPVESWADIARRVFERANGNGDAVVPVSTAEYYASAEGPVAPRPAHSALDLSRLEATGFAPEDWTVRLGEYLDRLLGAGEGGPGASAGEAR